MREELKNAVAKALQNIAIAGAEVSFEHTAEFKNGDYATGVAMRYAKQAGIAPRALAEKIVAELGTIAGISKIEIAGPGFIKFTI